MAEHTKWDGVAARVYYALGSLYYLYHWLVILGAASAIAAAAAAYFGSPHAVVFTLAGVAVLGVAIGTGIWLRSNKRRLEGPNPSLRLLDVDCAYEVLSDRCRTTRHIKAVALRDGADSFRHKFSWTGNGQISGTTTQRGISIDINDEPGGHQKVCVIRLARPLARREEVEFDYTLEQIGATEPVRPFFSMSINDWIRRRLSLRLRLPAEAKEYRKAIYMSPGAEIPMWKEEGRLPTGSSEVLWSIPRPRPRYKYSFTWW